MLSKLIIRTKQFYSVTYLKKIEQLFRQKKFEEILQISGRQNLTRNELKQNYHALIKKYHTDNCQNDQNKARVYEQITKIIISSYHNIDKSLFANKKQVYQDNFLQDQISMELFGKKYNQVKYWMYEPGNEKSKQAFFNKLFAATGQRPESSSSKPTAEYAKHYESTNTSRPTGTKNQKQDNQPNRVLGLGIAGAIALLGVFWYSSFKKNNSSPSIKRQQTKVYGHEDVRKAEEISFKIKDQKSKAMISSILKDHPPSLEYPEEDPHIMRQLTEYSIAPDIHLFEVLPKHFTTFKQQIQKNGLSMDKALPLTRIKPNTAMTLSLEAERALHNIYVKVKDVINEINQKGKYEPPQVFIKFHGYIMFKIRQKPMTLSNYKDTDYISLFDLYFNSYSPIFMKKDNFTQYLVGKDEKEYFGWVHLNNRKCAPVYLASGQKAAYFYAPKSEQIQAEYEKMWDLYYYRFLDRWREGGNTKKRAGI